MPTIEEVITTLRDRGVALTTTHDGKGNVKIGVDGALLPEERKFLHDHRDEAINYLRAHPSEASTPAPEPESPQAAYDRGFGDGLRAAIAEMEARASVAVTQETPLARTPEQELHKFRQWQLCRPGPYYFWEPECMEALRAELRPGDRIRPMYSYTCVIIRADGSEMEFERVPTGRGVK